MQLQLREHGQPGLCHTRHKVMELCILSNELNACEITAVLNPSKFASCATKQRKLSHRSELVYRVTSCRWKCKNTLFMHIPKIPVRGRCLKFNLSPMIRKCTASMVHCVAGVFENSRIERQNRVHEKQDLSRVPKKLLKYFVEMVDGNATQDLFT